MGQMGMELLAVTLSAAATALQVGISKLIVGNQWLCAAVAAAFPDHKPLRITLVCWLQRCQTAKSLARDIGPGIVLGMIAAAAMAPASCFEQRSQCFIFPAAAAQTPPTGALVFTLRRKSFQHRQFPENHARQIHSPAAGFCFDVHLSLHERKQPIRRLCTGGLLWVTCGSFCALPGRGSRERRRRSAAGPGRP